MSTCFPAEETCLHKGKPPQKLYNAPPVLSPVRGGAAKSRWPNAWTALADDKKKADALQAVFLSSAYNAYESGYPENLNHFYSGINALALRTVKAALAESLPETPNLSFDTGEEAAKKPAVVRPVQEKAAEAKTHFLLFAGHMIDKQGRKEPRFPKEKEAAARERIKEKAAAVKARWNTNVIGIAGGASGGDILFHEVCAELDIPTDLYLILPAEKFKAESVNFAGPDWVDRFDALYQKLPHRVLCNTKELPAWLQKKKDYSIWERNNLWMLNSALVNGGRNMTLMALWDGRGGDGPGGTQHMVQEARTRGANTIVIDVKTL